MTKKDEEFLSHENREFARMSAHLEYPDVFEKLERDPWPDEGLEPKGIA
jgi:hypothetical protein